MKKLKKWLLAILNASPKRELELAMAAESRAKREIEFLKEARDEWKDKYRKASAARDKYYKDRGDLIRLNKQLKCELTQLQEDLNSSRKELIASEKFYRQNTDMRLDTLRKKNKQTKKS